MRLLSPLLVISVMLFNQDYAVVMFAHGKT